MPTIINKPLYPEVVGRGNLGGGWRGFLDRFLRGAAQGAVPNTIREIANYPGPVAGALGGGLGQGVQGSAWWQRLVNRNPYFRNESMYPSELEEWQRAPNPEGVNAPPLPSSPYEAETFPYREGIAPSGMVPPPMPQGNFDQVMRDNARAALEASWAAGASGRGPNNRIGAGRGTTIAEDRAAQNMFGGMRDAANASMLQNQARNAMQNMFRDAER